MTEKLSKPKAPAVFLDRDGTINEDFGYISDPELVRLFGAAAPAIRRLNEAGVKVVVITNQSGIGRGYFSRMQLEAVHRRLRELLAAGGAHLDNIYYCPHSPEEACGCRKPSPGLMFQAAEELGLDLARSYMVGDRNRDVEAAARAGVKAILVPSVTGSAEDAQLAQGPGVKPAHVAADLLAAAEWILKDLAGEAKS